MIASFKRGAKRCFNYLNAKNIITPGGGLGPSERVHVDLNAERAARTFEAACILRDARVPEEALPLYQKSFLLFAHNAVLLSAASSCAKDAQPDQTQPDQTRSGLTQSEGGDVRTRFEQLEGWAQLRRCHPQFDELALLLRDENDISRREAQRRCDQLDELIRQLRDKWQMVSQRHVRGLRVVRWAVLLLSVVLMLVGYQAWRLFPRNVSSKKSVFVSSVIDGKNPAGIVDDQYYGFPAFVSKRERQPWVVIDLGKPYMVTDAQVVGRHDCCFGEAVPLDFEVSLDNNKFETVGTRTEPLTSLVPWVVPAIMRHARYVRVKSKKTATLGLSEVIVYGRQPH